MRIRRFGEIILDFVLFGFNRLIKATCTELGSGWDDRRRGDEKR